MISQRNFFISITANTIEGKYNDIKKDKEGIKTFLKTNFIRKELKFRGCNISCNFCPAFYLYIPEQNLKEIFNHQILANFL